MRVYNSRPTVCNICKGQVKFGNMKDIGIAPYQSGKCYYCTVCGAMVGTHRKNPKDALGILADNKTRHLRSLCHEEFDRHWYSLAGKNRAYYRLSKDLNIKSEDCHFGHMNEDMLNQALAIMKDWGSLNFR